MVTNVRITLKGPKQRRISIMLQPSDVLCPVAMMLRILRRVLPRVRHADRIIRRPGAVQHAHLALTNKELAYEHEVGIVFLSSNPSVRVFGRFCLVDDRALQEGVLPKCEALHNVRSLFLKLTRQVASSNPQLLEFVSGGAQSSWQNHPGLEDIISSGALGLTVEGVKVYADLSLSFANALSTA